MFNELKPIHAAIYLAAVGAMLAAFDNGIRPMLLNSPPKGFTLMGVAGLMAIMLYVMSQGPLWMARRTAYATLYLRHNLALVVVAASLTTGLFTTMYSTPAVAASTVEVKSRPTAPLAPIV